jgi:hypothetical protein
VIELIHSTTQNNNLNERKTLLSFFTLISHIIAFFSFVPGWVEESVLKEFPKFNNLPRGVGGHVGTWAIDSYMGRVGMIILSTWPSHRELLVILFFVRIQQRMEIVQ